MPRAWHVEGEGAGIGQLADVGHDPGRGRQGGAQHLEYPPVARFAADQILVNTLPDLGDLAGTGGPGLEIPQLAQDRRTAGPGAADDRHLGRVQVVHLAGIEVDTNDLAVDFQRRVETVDLGQFAADYQHHVGQVQVILYLAAHPASRERKRVRIVDDALARGAGNYRGAEFFGDPGDFLAGECRAAADQDHRLQRIAQQVAGAADLFCRRHGPLGRFDSLPAGASGHFQHVDGNRDVHWPRALAGKHREGPRDQLRHLLRVHRGGREGSQRRGGIGEAGNFVQAAPALAERVAGGVAGQYQQRNAVGIGLTDGGQRVGDTGSGNEQCDAGFSADARVAVSHETGALLIARLDMANAAAIETAAEFQRMHTGNAEQCVHAILLE